MAETRAGGLSPPLGERISAFLDFSSRATDASFIYIDRFFPSFHFISITGGGKIYTYIFITKKKNRRVATQRIVAREAKVSVRLNAASSTGERVLDGRNVDREQ